MERLIRLHWAQSKVLRSQTMIKCESKAFPNCEHLSSPHQYKNQQGFAADGIVYAYAF